MTHKTFEYDCECEDCGSTGLYVGFAENNSGVAVVCTRCGGTGKRHVKTAWTEFTRRKPRRNVDRVIEVNPGMALGNSSDVGGMSYKDWAAGKPFPLKSEMRLYTCPAWWYQAVDHDRMPVWKECRSTGNGYFSSCASFKTKEKCWQRWDEEKA